MIDANANRAREGLRVLEDISRFVLGDAQLARGCKELRHALTGAMRSLDATGTRLLAVRDTQGDVGTTLTSQAERGRESIEQLVQAEASRVGEALRVLEESCKLLEAGEGSSNHASSTCKQLRYRAYDLAKAIVLVSRTLQLRWQPSLCVLISSALCVHHTWQVVAQRAIDGGADCLQLREKELDGLALLARTRELVALAGSSPDVRVIVNDRVDIALASGAHGVHLGQSDLPAREARMLAAQAGKRLLVGVSTFSIQEARQAAEAGADVCGVGPMFATTTKHKPVLAGPGALERYLLDDVSKSVPHLAIGGITPGNVAELRAVGCKGIAVSSVVCGAADPRGVCERLLEKLR